MGRVVTLLGLGGVMVSTLAWNARNVRSIPALGTIFLVFITPMTLVAVTITLIIVVVYRCVYIYIYMCIYIYIYIYIKVTASMYIIVSIKRLTISWGQFCTDLSGKKLDR